MSQKEVYDWLDSKISNKIDEQINEEILTQVALKMMRDFDAVKVKVLSKKLFDYGVELYSISRILSLTKSREEQYGVRVYEVIEEAEPILEELVKELDKGNLFQLFEGLLKRDLITEEHLNEEYLYQTERDILKFFGSTTVEGSTFNLIMKQIKANGKIDLKDLLMSYNELDDLSILMGPNTEEEVEGKMDRITLWKKSMSFGQIFGGVALIGLNGSVFYITSGITMPLGPTIGSIGGGYGLAIQGLKTIRK